MNENDMTKPKTSKLAIASAICLVAFFTFGFVVSSLDPSNKQLEVFLAVASYTPLAACPILASFAMIRILLSNGRLKGANCARTTFITSSIFLFFAAAMGPLHQTTQIAQRVVCGTNLKGLHTAMIVYTKDFDDQLPTPEKWCDLLVTTVDVSPRSFTCRSSDTTEGESSYALNKHVAHMKFSQIPNDVVLLFETSAGKSNTERDYPLKERTFVKEMPNEFRYKDSEMVQKDRFNQVAGPETLAIKTHKEYSDQGCNVVQADGIPQFVKFKDLPKLRWDAENKVKFPAHLFEIPVIQNVFPRDPVLLTILIVFVLATCLSAILLLKRFHFTQHWKFATVLAIPCALAGLIFGGMGEVMCYFDRTVAGTGLVAGALFGVLTALCYASILADTRPVIKDNRSFRSYAIYTGIAAGMICSTLTHIAIITANYPTQTFGLVSGQIFGIITGAILGAICGLYVEMSHQTKESII